MKRIAITSRLIKCDNYFEIREALDVKWANFLEKAELLPLLLPYKFSDINLFLKDLKVEGVLLTGGNDLALFSNDELSLKRDRFEKKVFEVAIKEDLPVLGVCRGAQFIADHFGSLLKKVNAHVAKRHDITVNQKSRYYEFIKNRGKVNSYHSYAVSKLSQELIVTARCTDGVIEAIEHKEKDLLGIMWHPEREKVFNVKDVQLFRRFFK